MIRNCTYQRYIIWNTYAWYNEKAQTQKCCLTQTQTSPHAYTLTQTYANTQTNTPT